MRNRAKQGGFTLIELVVVVLILGILAGVAAPRLFNQAAQASENSARTTLSIVRDAIELFASQNGGVRPGADIANDLLPLLRGNTFPTCPVGNNNNNVALSAVVTATGEGWAYNQATGDFFINSAAASATAPGVNLNQF